jgi:hypothetical protein
MGGIALRLALYLPSRSLESVHADRSECSAWTEGDAQPGRSVSLFAALLSSRQITSVATAAHRAIATRPLEDVSVGVAQRCTLAGAAVELDEGVAIPK